MSAVLRRLGTYSEFSEVLFMLLLLFWFLLLFALVVSYFVVLSCAFLPLLVMVSCLVSPPCDYYFSPPVSS